jgi:hypothetical protein
VNRVGTRSSTKSPAAPLATCGGSGAIRHLGICKLRYPALWERMSGGDLAVIDFSWTDERLPAMLCGSGWSRADSRTALRTIADDPCPPDVIGINPLLVD